MVLYAGMDTSPSLHRAVELTSLTEIARTCGVTYKAVAKWRDRGCLPRTEFTGETRYAEAIERLTGGQVTAEELLSVRRPARTRTGPRPADAPASVQP